MDLQASDDSNKDNIDEEYSSLKRFGAHLKNSIFSIMFYLLKEHEMSIYVSIFLCGIEFLQVISLIFHAEFFSAWGSPNITDVISKGLGYTRLITYVKDSDMTVYSSVFYVLIGVLVFVIVDAVYVYYVFQTKKATFTWPVTILRIMAILIPSVLFLPIFEYFISFFSCTTDAGGRSVHSIFREQQCGVGMHLANSILSALCVVILISITVIATLTFFEGRNLPSHPNSRVTSRASFLFNMYKGILVVLLTFLKGEDYQTVLIIFIMAGSLLIFSMLQFDNPFYNAVIARVWSTAGAVNLWSATMLVFARVMKNTNFTESVITWILGLPLVLLLTLKTNDKRMDYLLINVNQFDSGKEIINQVTYLLKLLDTQHKDHNSAVLLDGYLEVHKQDCPEENCPLKRKNKILSKNKVARNLLSSDPNLSEKEAIIIYLVYQLYLGGLAKFPTNTTLHISYAFFLLDKMHSKQQALTELTETEQKHPPFDEQFIIFRYKKIIEDEIAESQNEQTGGLDLVNEMSFQTHLRMCQANIEKAALLHMEFWSQLSEDQPDLAKLADIGGKINASVRSVDEHWGKLMKINPNNTKAMRMFGKFLVEIVHDKERGEELLNKARNVTNINANKKNGNYVPTDDVADEGTPIVVISGEQDRFAIITSINLAAASLFGFNKTELLNRKVNALMPPLFAKYHDTFIDHYLTHNESAIVNKNKERLAFGKNKANYIFPFFYNIRAIPSIIQGIQFISSLRVEKNLKNTAYVLTNPDGSIDSISSSCITLLKMDIKNILSKKIKIQDCVPNILLERASLFSNLSANSKSHTRVMFSYPKGSEYLQDGEDQTVPLGCQLNELTTSHIKDMSFGFQIRFEKVFEQMQTLAPLEARISNFQFRFHKNKANVIGEFMEGNVDDGIVKIGLTDDAKTENGSVKIPQHEELNQGEAIDMGASAVKRDTEGDEEPGERIQYGLGIKTLRLMHGSITEIEELKSDEVDDREGNENAGLTGKRDVRGSAGDDGQEEGSLADFGDAEKSKKVLISVINDKTPPHNIRNLKLALVAMSLVLIGLSIFDYVNIVSKVDGINVNLNHLDVSHRLVANMMITLSGVRDLYLMGQNIVSMDEVGIRESLRQALNSAKLLKENLEIDEADLSSSHLNLLNNPVVPLRTFDGEVAWKGLVQATEDMITKGLNMLGASLSSISPSNPDYYFLTVNLLNDYYMALITSSEYYAQELMQRTKSDTTSFILVLVFSIVTLVITVGVLGPIIYSVVKAREHILSLFFDIPSHTVKQLFSKCETFVSNLQVGEDDEVTSELDEEEMDKANEENESTEWMPRKRRRKFKNTGKNYRVFFFRYLIVGCILEAAFIYNYISSNSLLNSVSGVATEFNSTSYAEFFYSFANNAQRQLFINSSISILNQDAETVVSNNILLMQSLDSQILSENSLNVESHTDEYNTIFKQVVYQDSCGLLADEVDFNACENFADGTITKGMTVAIVRHFENLRTLLKGYKNITTSNAWSFDPSYLSPPLDLDPKRNMILSLFRVPQAIETAEMQRTYVMSSYRRLLEGFKISLKDEFDNLATLRIIIFLLFIIGVIVIFIFVWMPMVSRLNTKLWKTKSMLRMIPISILVKIKNIRAYLRNFLNENHLHNF